MFQQLITNLSGMVRHDQLEGRDYLVVPMIMLTEGVHAGSEGPLYYPPEELSKTPAVWNHKPIIVYHPQAGISGCDPEVLNNRKVGIILNTKFVKGNAKRKQPGRLHAEAWLEKARLDAVDKRIVENLENGEVTEVSTGLFTDNAGPEGEWNGEKYNAVARNYRPDHLAILPDQVGACSVADGAGLLRNQQGIVFGVTEEGKAAEALYNRYYSAKERDSMESSDFGDPGKKAFPVHDQEDLDNAARLIGHAGDPAAVKRRLIEIAKRKGLKVPESWKSKKGTTNAVPLAPSTMSHDTIRERIYEAYRNGRGVDGRPADGYSVGTNGDPGHIQDVYDDFHIMSRHDPKTGDRKLYRQYHDVTPEGECYLSGIPEEVRRVQEYRTVDGTFVGNASPVQPKEGEGVQMEKKQRVDHLIANGGWEEGDRQTLLGFSDAKLEKLCANTKTPIAKPETSAPATNGTPAPKAPTVEEYVNNAPGPIREILASGLKAQEVERARLVDIIVANKANKFTKEYLGQQTLEFLGGLAAIAAPVSVDAAYRAPMFIGAGTDMHPTTNTGELPPPLDLPTMNFARPAPKGTETAAAAK